MSHARLAAAAVLAAALSVASGASGEEPIYAPNVTTFALDNGLQVVVIPNHRAPVVTQMVWYKIGAADDPPGKSGIAHFLEHLMFKGTTTYPDGDFSERISMLGGNDNATTTDETTTYYQTVASEHLGVVMSFEADRMANLLITDDRLLPERQVILEERGRSIDNSPGATLNVMMNGALFMNSHYATPTIGWAHEMATLDRADALAFYDKYYTPNNAILVIAGDVTEDEVRKLAEDTYGKLPRRAEPPPRIRPREPEPLAARTVTLSDPRVTRPSWQRLYLAPSEISGEPGEAAALDVLAEILGGNASSRLRRLVIDEPIASGANAGYGGSNIGDDAFRISASPREGVTLDELEKDVDQIVADVVEKGVTEEEVARAKLGVKAAVVYAEDSPGSLARTFGSSLARGETVEYVQHWPDRVAAVTVDEVNAVARKYLDIRRSVTGRLLPAGETPDANPNRS